MKHKKKILLSLMLITGLFLTTSISVFASSITKAEVEQAVATQGKESVTGNLFIWFLCAIAFLKVSQKINSFMASLGINVGNTGGNMLAELMIAGRSLTGSMRNHGGGGYHSTTSPGKTAVEGTFLSGGLAGAVGRQLERSAVDAATGYSDKPSIGNSIYRSSLNKGGDFANKVISTIAHGNYNQIGSIKGADAEKAYKSYMGMTEKEAASLPNYSNIEIGGGRITGTESSDIGNRDFAMYNSEQYMTPTGAYDTVQSVDGSTWYRQYAQPTVSRTPYENSDGNIAYHESIVQQVPKAPPRKDRA